MLALRPDQRELAPAGQDSLEPEATVRRESRREPPHVGLDRLQQARRPAAGIDTRDLDDSGEDDRLRRFGVQVEARGLALADLAVPLDLGPSLARRHAEEADAARPDLGRSQADLPGTGSQPLEAIATSGGHPRRPRAPVAVPDPDDQPHSLLAGPDEHPALDRAALSQRDRHVLETDRGVELDESVLAGDVAVGGSTDPVQPELLEREAEGPVALAQHSRVGLHEEHGEPVRECSSSLEDTEKLDPRTGHGFPASEDTAADPGLAHHLRLHALRRVPRIERTEDRTREARRVDLDHELVRRRAKPRPTSRVTAGRDRPPARPLAPLAASR